MASVFHKGPIVAAAQARSRSSGQYRCVCVAQRVYSFVTVAALAFITWDILIHLDDEIQYMWR